jgi:hypothetical protein
MTGKGNITSERAFRDANMLRCSVLSVFIERHGFSTVSSTWSPESHDELLPDKL